MHSHIAAEGTTEAGNDPYTGLGVFFQNNNMPIMVALTIDSKILCLIIKIMKYMQKGRMDRVFKPKLLQLR